MAFHHLKKQKLLSIVVTVQNRRFLAATAIFVVNPHPKIFCTKICKGERNANFKNAQFIIFLSYSRGLVLQIEHCRMYFLGGGVRHARGFS